MPDELRRTYWDACVLLSYINGIPDRLPTIEELIRLSRASEFEIVTSVLSQAEVAFAAIEKEQGKLSMGTEEAIDKLWLPGSPIKTVEFYDLIAREARDIMRQGIEQGWGSLKPADAIHLATARRMEVSEMHTYDDRLLKWNGRLGFAVVQPLLQQPTLDTGVELPES